jgi:hypothetical protein
MNKKEKPLGCLTGRRQGAGNGRYLKQNTALSCHCQAHPPISWLIRSYLIKTLVLQRYADVLLVCAGFVEEVGYAWN